jgi:hypothetical protein
MDTRADAHDPPEAVIEGRQVIEAGIESDGRDRLVGQPQADRGAVKAGAQDILVWRHAHNLPKRAQEVKSAHCRLRRQRVQ